NYFRRKKAGRPACDDWLRMAEPLPQRSSSAKKHCGKEQSSEDSHLERSAAVGCAEGGQALLGGFHLREAAALLFDQVVLDAAAVFGRLEKLFPRCHAFTEKDRVAFAGVGRPLLAMHGAYAAGIGLDPGDGVGTRFKASANVQLQH